MEPTRPCTKCGAPLCQTCLDFPEKKLHKNECELFCSTREKPFSITNIEEARKLYCYLTPLRFLLKAKNDKTTDIWDLEDNLEQRKGTLMFCFNQANAAKPIKALLGSDPVFNIEQVRTFESLILQLILLHSFL